MLKHTINIYRFAVTFMGTAYISAPWKSATAIEIEDVMSKAVIGQIDTRGLTCAEISS